jgi:hypothetical protein
VETRATLAATALFVAVLIIAAISGYTANPARRGPVSLWSALCVVVLKIVIIGIAWGLAWLLAESFFERRSSGEMALALALGVSIMWATSIAVQFAQNLFYARLGAPTRPIRWWNGQRLRRRKGASPPA